jgi:hypothetical protein
MHGLLFLATGHRIDGVRDTEDQRGSARREQIASCFLRLRATVVAVAVLLFCQCGSDRVDIKLWNVRRAQLQCLTCGQEAWLDGFTVSEFDPVKLLMSAVVDQARKHRKRSPDDVQRMQEQRTSVRQRPR